VRALRRATSPGATPRTRPAAACIESSVAAPHPLFLRPLLDSGSLVPLRSTSLLPLLRHRYLPLHCILCCCALSLSAEQRLVPPHRVLSCCVDPCPEALHLGLLSPAPRQRHTPQARPAAPAAGRAGPHRAFGPTLFPCRCAASYCWGLFARGSAMIFSISSGVRGSLAVRSWLPSAVTRTSSSMRTPIFSSGM